MKSQFTINCEQHCFDLFTSARKNIASSNIYNSKSTALLNYISYHLVDDLDFICFDVHRPYYC